MSDQDEGEIVPFPPLPPAPLPPRFPPDPRQRTRNRIVGAISSQLSEGEMQLAADIGVTGYPASGVNLGQIKDALEDALERFSMATLQARWDSDVRSFVLSVLHAWVQRAKHLKADLCDKGIAIEIETQDDHGYYHYRFDVFRAGADLPVSSPTMATIPLRTSSPSGSSMRRQLVSRTYKFDRRKAGGSRGACVTTTSTRSSLSASASEATEARDSGRGRRHCSASTW